VERFAIIPQHGRAPIIVAVPAKNEAERIPSCLTALDDQYQRPDAVVLLLNNCTDATEAITRVMAPCLRFRLDVVCRNLPAAQANAGHARRLAMTLAAKRAGPNGVLLTTDADSVVPPDWVRRNLAALHRGADLVCGRAMIDPIEAAMIPAHLHADDALECRLAALLDDIAWMLDPDLHDPHPRHTEASGASLAVSVETYHRVGGIPAVPSGEDRAFVEALQRMDARIRHDPAIKVIVSGRIVGRAAGGMADTIRRRIVRQDEFIDGDLEPAEHAFRRCSLRQRARAAWLAQSADPALAVDLDIEPLALADALSQRFFGAAWIDLETVSPRLKRRRVRFADLPAEIARAEALLNQIASPDVLAAD
jgi:glycosyltransferase involved in cell wall biosynthesis